MLSKIRPLWLTSALPVLAGWPQTVHALSSTAIYNMTDVTNQVGGSFLQNVAFNLVGQNGFLVLGSNFEFGWIVQNVATRFLPLLNIVAVLVIVVAGSLAIIAQDENRIQTARKVVAMAIVAILLVNIANAITQAFVTAFDFDLGQADPEAGAGILRDEILGWIKWIETPIAIIAILVIIISGIRCVVDYGTEKGVAQIRKTVMSVLFGIFLILAKLLISSAVVSGDPINMVQAVSHLTVTILGYTAMAALAMIVVAGIYMVANLGNEEQYTKAKKLIARVIIGLLVIMVSVGVAFVVVGIS